MVVLPPEIADARTESVQVHFAMRAARGPLCFGRAADVVRKAISQERAGRLASSEDKE